MTHHFALSVLLFSFFVESATAQRMLEPRDLHERISAGIDLILRQKYVAADSVFRGVVLDYPEHPAGYLFLVGVLQANALDYEELLEPFEAESLFDRAQRGIDAMLREDADDAWGHLFQGTLDLYDSFLRVQRGEWFRGVSKALASAASFRKALECDSAMVDALAGLGTYLYWKSRKTEFLHWLPFVSDDREVGIAYLQRCASSGVYNRYVAINSLINIFLEEKRYDDALRYADTALAHYPFNRSFLWGKATALDRMGNAQAAAQVYSRLLDEILADTAENRYNELVCRLNLAKNLIALKQFPAARAQLVVIGTFKPAQFRPHLRARAAAKIQDARTLLDSLSRNGAR